MSAVRTGSASGSRAIPTFVVGLDYGTHSTKIVVKRRNDETADAVVVDPRLALEPDGYPWFAAPSLVLIADGKLWFGREALRRQSRGDLRASLKVMLLGRTAMDVNGQAEVDLLVTAYLAWILAGVRRQICERTEGVEPRILLNVAAPMDHFEKPELKQRYLRLIHAAWGAAIEPATPTCDQGIELARARDLFGQRLEVCSSPEDQAERPFDVLPETVAPLISMSHDPDCEPGLYAVVDMGAGTTEISITHVGEPDSNQKILCYQDVSFEFGGDRFANAALREQFELATRFQGELRRAWAAGFSKDARNRVTLERWRTLRILRTGGAGRHPMIERRLADGHPTSVKGRAAMIEVRRYSWKEWYVPPVRLPGSNPDRQMQHLLAVAHGLAFERAHWREWFRPSDIDALDPDEARETDLYRYMD